MKFRVSFKTPDVIEHAIVDLLQNNEVEDEIDFADDIRSFTSNWVKYQEYITIEFDTETNTATVVKV